MKKTYILFLLALAFTNAQARIKKADYYKVAESAAAKVAALTADAVEVPRTPTVVVPVTVTKVTEVKTNVSEVKAEAEVKPKVTTKDGNAPVYCPKCGVAHNAHVMHGSQYNYVWCPETNMYIEVLK